MDKNSGNDLRAFIRQASQAPQCRTRIAPTPSGFLHAGNAINFILNALCARVHPQGSLLLRIDDLDADRKRPEYVADIFDTLQWLGIHWDTGPQNPEEFEQEWAQRLFIDQIDMLLTHLVADNNLFACQKSRSELAPYEGNYPEAFRNQGVALTAPQTAWRANTPPDFPLPCFIVRRRDGIPAYQLASIFFDTHFGITHIIRGADLKTSSEAQYWLAKKAGLTAYQQVKTWHHPLVVDDKGVKLSKSAGATALHNLYHKNESPTLLFQTVSKWLGLPDENLQNFTDLVALFNEHVL